MLNVFVQLNPPARPRTTAVLLYALTPHPCFALSTAFSAVVRPHKPPTMPLPQKRTENDSSSTDCCRVKTLCDLVSVAPVCDSPTGNNLCTSSLGRYNFGRLLL